MRQGFHWKTCRKDPPGTRRGRWENNTKMDLKLGGKTSTGFIRLNIRTRSLDFRVHKTLYRDYQLLKKDSVPWSQPVCYGGWVGYLLRGIMKQRPKVVDTRYIITLCISPLPPPNATTCSYELSWFPSWLWR